MSIFTENLVAAIFYLDAPNWKYVPCFKQLEARMQMHTDASIDQLMDTYDSPSQYGLTDMDYYEV